MRSGKASFGGKKAGKYKHSGTSENGVSEVKSMKVIEAETSLDLATEKKVEDVENETTYENTAFVREQ